jgi:hypothetical protein
MANSTSNIEPIARDLCFKELSGLGYEGEVLEHKVDSLWHGFAMALEMGFIDENGNKLVEYDYSSEFEPAYREWIEQHPEFMPSK